MFNFFYRNRKKDSEEINNFNKGNFSDNHSIKSLNIFNCTPLKDENVSTI